MAFYPINVCLEGRNCLVVGGGAVAERKARALMAAQAVVTVIAPELTEGLTALTELEQVQWLARPYRPGEGAAYFLVIAATDQGTVNAQVAADALGAGRLVNVADDPLAGNFHVPAQVARGDLLLTVSTGGKSPAFARQIRQELEGHYGPEYGTYLDFLEEIRQQMKSILAMPAQREAFWRAALAPGVLDLLAQGKRKEAEELIYNAISCTGS